MRIDRRLTFIGVMLIVLSMTMATQYATTKVSFAYGIVNPSNSDIRFVGSDNSSDSSGRVLRVAANTSNNMVATLALGNWTPNSIKNYTAAFAIVNEEGFAVNITHINVSGTGTSYISVWLHGNRSKDVTEESTSAKLRVVNGGSAVFSASSCAWVLAAGNGVKTNMKGKNATGVLTQLLTPWDTTRNVRYNQTTDYYAENGTTDFVWVEISLSILTDAAPLSASGTIWIHFEATTHA